MCFEGRSEDRSKEDRVFAAVNILGKEVPNISLKFRMICTQTVFGRLHFRVRSAHKLQWDEAS